MRPRPPAWSWPRAPTPCRRAGPGRLLTAEPYRRAIHPSTPSVSARAVQTTNDHQPVSSATSAKNGDASRRTTVTARLPAAGERRRPVAAYQPTAAASRSGPAAATTVSPRTSTAGGRHLHHAVDLGCLMRAGRRGLVHVPTSVPTRASRRSAVMRSWRSRSSASRSSTRDRSTFPSRSAERPPRNRRRSHTNRVRRCRRSG